MSINILRILILFSDSDHSYVEVLGTCDSTGFCFYLMACVLCVIGNVLL